MKNLRSVSLTCALLVVACGDDDDDKNQPDSSTHKPVDAGGGLDASRDASTDAGANANLGCGGDLVCVAPQGVYICEKPGPKVITCDRVTDCPAEAPMCFPLSGQGVCLALCTPPEGLPATTSMSGRVIEYVAGSGMTGTSETTTDPKLAGVEVCIESPAQLKTQFGCKTTDANGKFTFDGLPPNRNAAQTVGGLLSFKKDGYVPQLAGYSLGNGSQNIADSIRLMTVPYATEVANKLGATLPSATTGWVIASAARFNLTNAQTPYNYNALGTELYMIPGVSVGSAPAAGKGPIYLDDGEKVPGSSIQDGGIGAGLDAGLADAGDAGSNPGATSQSGALLFVDVPATAPATQYTLTFTHATLNCGAPATVNVVPGFIYSGADAVCGNGAVQ